LRGAGSAEALGSGKPWYGIADGLHAGAVTYLVDDLFHQALRGIGIRGLVDGRQPLGDIVHAG
jgi:hypothetical protein